jgi:hypothetical protein
LLLSALLAYRKSQGGVTTLKVWYFGVTQRLSAHR